MSGLVPPVARPVVQPGPGPREHGVGSSGCRLKGVLWCPGVGGLPPPPGPMFCSKASATGLQPDGASPKPVSPFLRESGHSQASGQPWTPDTLRGVGPQGSLSLAFQAGSPRPPYQDAPREGHRTGPGRAPHAGGRVLL